MLDLLNAEHSRGAVKADEFTRETLSMHFYDSCAVFEKGTTGRKWAPMIGGTHSEEADANAVLRREIEEQKSHAIALQKEIAERSSEIIAHAQSVVSLRDQLN